MLLVGDSAELWLRAGWRVRATVHGAVSGSNHSNQLVLEVCGLELPKLFDHPPGNGNREERSRFYFREVVVVHRKREGRKDGRCPGRKMGVGPWL